MWLVLNGKCDQGAISLRVLVSVTEVCQYFPREAFPNLYRRAFEVFAISASLHDRLKALGVAYRTRAGQDDMVAYDFDFVTGLLDRADLPLSEGRGTVGADDGSVPT